MRTEPLFESEGRPSLAPDLQGIGIFTATGPYTWRRHQHLNYELIVPISGRYACTIGRERLALGRSEALLVQPLDWHEDLLAGEARYWAIQFALGGTMGATTAVLRPDAPTRARIFAPPTAELADAIERLRGECARDDAAATLMRQSALSAVVALVVRALDPRSLSPALLSAATERFPARLERLFASHQHGRLAVAAMARELGMSATALGLRCRRALGMSPARAFARYRLECARALLERTAMTVVEVSEHLGFANPYHFSRAFRRCHGLPPSRLRGASRRRPR